MVNAKNIDFGNAVQGARNAEVEIVRFCTARLRVPRNAAIYPKNEFLAIA